MSSINLYDRKLILFSGKGGVGKTTIASAFALSCARRGERTLLLELNAKEKTSQLFGSREVSSEITEVEENLFAVNVTPQAALEEYGLMILRVKLIYRAVFENRIIQSFLRVIPGLNELLMLGKAYFHVTEVNPDGKPTWDKVVIDAPATGHGIFFLQIPSVITSIISSGQMYDEAIRIQELLTDANRTALNLVTLAEDMPVNETLMLRDVVLNKLKMPLGYIIANGIYRPLFNDDEQTWVERAHDLGQNLSPKKSRLSGFVNAARFRALRVGMQQHYLKRLYEQNDTVPVIEIPYYFTKYMNFLTVREISQDLENQLSPDQAINLDSEVHMRRGHA